MTNAVDRNAATLAQMIGDALALADELCLPIVGIHLDEALELLRYPVDMVVADQGASARPLN